MKLSRTILTILLTILISTSSLQAVQIGDLVRVKGSEKSTLVGMGLVVGLKGTGDGGKFRPAMDPLARVIRHFIDESTLVGELKDSKNVALVALEATTSASGTREGDRVDVYVSAVGSAKSLAGGRLLMMPMTGPLADSPVFAFASGAVSIEDIEVPTAGIVRQGAQLVSDIPARFVKNGRLTLVIKDANATFQTATTIASTINAFDPDEPDTAMAVDQKNIVVKIPQAELQRPTLFIAEILRTFLSADFIETGARVRINEKTGTIVMSGDVQISPVSISHGGLSITTITPRPASTAQVPRIEQQHTVVLDPGKIGGAKLSDLVAAFNQLKVGIKDRIAIIREIHAMGKLHADLTFE